jgi:hypothetical protein
MRGWSAALLGLVLVSLSSASPSPGASSATGEPTSRASYDRAASARSLGQQGYALQWDESRGLPRKILRVAAGRDAGVRDGASPEARAEAFLSAHAHVLLGPEDVAVAGTGGAGAVTTLRTALSRASLSGTQVVKHQFYRGVRVDGAEVRVNMDTRGAVMSVLSSFRPGIRLETVRPVLTAAEALRAALQSIDRPGTTRQEPSAELVVIADGDGGRLAYRTEIPLWSPFGDFVSLVDAATGEVLSTRDITIRERPSHGRVDLLPPPGWPPSREATISKASVAAGTGMVLPANPLNGHPERYDLRDGDDVDIFRESKTIERLDGSGLLKGTYVDVFNGDQARIVSPTLVFDYSASVENGPFQEVNAYWHVDTFQDYIQSRLGILNAANRAQVLMVHGREDDQSVYNPITQDIDYGDGGVDDSEDGEIVLHEYGHAIHDDISGIGGLECGAISEGLGDYLAASFGGNPLEGEWDATSYNPGPPPLLRRTDTEKHYPEDLDPYGEVHNDGEIISSAWWHLREAIGPELTDQLVIESFFQLGPDILMSDVADATLQVDESIYGGAHEAAIRTAYGDRGILPAVPVLAGGLRAVGEGRGIRVSWQMYAKDRVTGIHLQRAVNGSAFSRVRDVAPLSPELGGMSAFDPGSGLRPGDDLTYRLEMTMADGSTALLPGEAHARYAPALPVGYSLAQNVPNPFNPSTSITFALPREAPTTLVIYDLGGRRVVQLVDAVLSAGTFQVDWDGKDAAGRRVSTGTYFYRLSSGSFLQTRKMTLMK